MTEAQKDVLEVSGFVVGAGGAVVLAYGLWLIAPELMLLVFGVSGMLTGCFLIWAGNRGAP
jgi:hypothetical protein